MDKTHGHPVERRRRPLAFGWRIGRRRFRARRVKGPAAAIVLFGLALVLAAGCGDGEPEVVTTTVEARPPARTLPPATPRVAATAPTPSVADRADQSRTVPELGTGQPAPPRVVTYQEAEAAYLDRSYDEAFELFTVYAGSKPENPWGFYMLGLSAWKAGEHDEAESAFQESIRLDSQHVKSFVNLARVLVEVGRPAEAKDYVTTALELDESASAYRVLGNVNHELNQLDEAVEAYHGAILLDGEDVWAMNNLGLVLIQQGRYEEALGPLARATEIDDGVAVFQNNLGVALERTGHLAASSEAFRTALELDESYEKASVSLDRVSQRVDESEAEFDLVALARGFEEEVESWRISLDAVGDPEAPAPESAGVDVLPLVVVEVNADSTPQPDVPVIDSVPNPGK